MPSAPLRRSPWTKAPQPSQPQPDLWQRMAESKPHRTPIMDRIAQKK